MSARNALPDHAAGYAVGNRLIGEVMTARLLTVHEGESVSISWELLRRSRFHHLPVVTGDGRCVGVIDTATLATEYARTGLVMTTSRVGELLRGRRRPRVSIHATVGRAARIMTEGQTDALPVLDSTGRLAGLVTAADLVALLATGVRPDGEPPSSIERP